VNDEDLALAVGLARERLRRHRRFMLAPTTVTLGSDPALPTILDGEPVILHYSMEDSQQIMAYAIDRSLTLGQFIDGFNTTMSVMFGPMQADVKVNLSPFSGNHTHQMSNMGNGHLGVAYPNGPMGVAIAVPVGGELSWYDAYTQQHVPITTNKT